jgi:hypothetical protein
MKSSCDEQRPSAAHRCEINPAARERNQQRFVQQPERGREKPERTGTIVRSDRDRDGDRGKDRDDDDDGVDHESTKTRQKPA